MASHGVPRDLDHLVAQWDHFIAAAIYKVSRGHVRPDEVPDMKQAIYLRIIETHYLDRCRVLLAERGGSFSTYLWLLCRSVLINQFSKNAHTALNHAVRIEHFKDRVRSRHVRSVRRGHAFSMTETAVLIAETYADLVDQRFERQQIAREWLDKFEAHLAATSPDWGPTITLATGEETRRSLALVFRLWRRFKDTCGPEGWVEEVAAVLRQKPGTVLYHMRRVRAAAAQFAGRSSWTPVPV